MMIGIPNTSTGMKLLNVIGNSFIIIVAKNKHAERMLVVKIVEAI